MLAKAFFAKLKLLSLDRTECAVHVPSFLLIFPRAPRPTSAARPAPSAPSALLRFPVFRSETPESCPRKYRPARSARPPRQTAVHPGSRSRQADPHWFGCTQASSEKSWGCTRPPGRAPAGSIVVPASAGNRVPTSRPRARREAAQVLEAGLECNANRARDRAGAAAAQRRSAAIRRAVKRGRRRAGVCQSDIFVDGCSRPVPQDKFSIGNLIFSGALSVDGIRMGEGSYAS